MKFALGLPTGDVPVGFATDLARVTGYLVSTRPGIEMRFLEADDKDAILDVAREWGADLMLLLNADARFPVDAFDPVLDRFIAERAKPKLVIAKVLRGDA